MRFEVFIVVLFAAALHASWNAVVKGGTDKLLGTVMVTGSAAGISAICLFFVPAPARESWPFLAVSAVLEVGYNLLLANAYRFAEMNLVYPVMRGAAPLLVAVVGFLAIGERLSPAGMGGVAMISFGVFSMAGKGLRSGNKGVALALLNAVVIASYTLVDGIGVRRSGTPVSYTLWIFLLSGGALTLWALATRRQALCSYVGRHWRMGIFGGVGSLASYGIALWAMTTAPVALVAALRETAIVFGVAISAFVLRERVGKARLIAVCGIAMGAAVLRMA